MKLLKVQAIFLCSHFLWKQNMKALIQTTRRFNLIPDEDFPDQSITSAKEVFDLAHAR